jgi:hydrogenase/urease accessory protein HupE
LGGLTHPRPASPALARLLGVVTFLLAWLASPLASAHEVGVSRGDYVWQQGQLTARITLTRRELSSAIPWLRGETGAESPVAFEEHREALGQWVFERVGVLADGHACPLQTRDMKLDGDGVLLVGSYLCPADAGRLAIDVGFVPSLARGHRHFVSFVRDASTIEDVVNAAKPELTVALGVDSPSPSRVPFARLVGMGVEHILTGYDHLLFLLGLVLIGGPMRSLLAAVTAFTAAHSITLAASALGVWTPSPRFIEPCIALSIVYVGIENWFVRDARGRWRLTMLFGLVHGFGFASALREIALPRADVPRALLGFNVGVELGQLAILALLFPLVLAARKRDLWGQYGMRACTIAIALVGLFWFVTRLRNPL